MSNSNSARSPALTADAHPRLRFRNATTGEPPTLADWHAMRERAHRVLDRWRYASSEQVDWAMLVDPEYAEQLCGTFAP